MTLQALYYIRVLFLLHCINLNAINVYIFNIFIYTNVIFNSIHWYTMQCLFRHFWHQGKNKKLKNFTVIFDDSSSIYNAKTSINKFNDRCTGVSCTYWELIYRQYKMKFSLLLYINLLASILMTQKVDSMLIL